MTFKTPVPQKVLLVDDQVEVLKSLKMCLEIFGLETVSASSGEQALALVSETPFDLILLDIDMPGMDGFEVCRRLKSEARFAHIPVIFISGRTAFYDREKAVSLGAVDYLAKPFDLQTLKECVMAALSGDTGLSEASSQPGHFF